MSSHRIVYTGTRPPAALAHAGVVHVPMLETRPRDFDESTVRDFATDGANIVFYSGNAVAAVAETSRLLHEAPPAADFWAVGQKTADALAEYQIAAQSPSDERFEGLLRELPAGRHISMELEGGDRSLADVRPHDDVLTVICYASVPRNYDSLALWLEPPPEWVVFTSPRGFEAFAAHAESAQILETSRLAAIGPTTASEMTDRGHTPHFVPSKPDASALIEELLTIDAPTQ